MRYKNIYYNKYLGMDVGIGFHLFPLSTICDDLLPRFPKPIVFNELEKIQRPFKRFFACFFFLPFPERSFITRGIPTEASIARPFPFKATLPLPLTFLPAILENMYVTPEISGVEKR